MPTEISAEERRYRQMVAQNRIRETLEATGEFYYAVLVDVVVFKLREEGIPLPHEDVAAMVDHMMEDA